MTLCCAKWTANTALCSTGDMASALWLHGCVDCCWAHTWSLSHEQHSVILSSFKLAGGLNSKLASSVGGGLQCIRSMDPTMQIQLFNTRVVKLVCATEQLWKEWQRLTVSRFRQNHLLNALNVNTLTSSKCFLPFGTFFIHFQQQRERSGVLEWVHGVHQVWCVS